MRTAVWIWGDNAEPQTRPESEIAGYRNVLARIHAGSLVPPVTPDLIRELHAGIYAYLPGEGGNWKQRDNVIRQILPGGHETVRFVPLPADETPAAMDELCRRMQELWEAETVDRLLLIDAFVVDFLCIHPFADGNGRVARLLTLLLLYAAGYEVGRYISIERIIENTRETYYEALRLSSQRWDTGEHDLTPWHQYSLSTLVYAYREFEQRVGEVAMAAGGKTESVKSAIEAFRPGETFTIGDLERICPTVSRATIRRVLDALRKQGRVQCLGAGRSARWRKVQM